MLLEDFVCFKITAEVVVGATFQKGQFIIQVDELRQQNRVCPWLVLSLKA